MIIAVPRLRDRQNSAYRHRNEGRFRKRRRPSAFQLWLANSRKDCSRLELAVFSISMPATLSPPTDIADRLGEAVRLQSEIDKLQGKLATLFAGVPKNFLIRDRYGLTAGEMNKIARNLHAKAKERIAQGRSKEFRGSIEELL
jgi:hypothetical protein